MKQQLFSQVTGKFIPGFGTKAFQFGHGFAILLLAQRHLEDAGRDVV